jgi:hypothetical protein
MVCFATTFRQQQVWCLGLFIPLPPNYLRLLKLVEVQRSARHIGDHIHAILVLSVHPKTLHILCVCVYLVLGLG